MGDSNPTVKDWIVAFRLRTLPLSLSCILMGSFLAYSKGVFDSIIFSLAMLTTVLLQILSNLANDYGDSQHGADSKIRQGPSRSVQAGLITGRQMKNAVKLFSALSFIAGVSLLMFSFKDQIVFLLVFLGLGLLAIWAAITYTAGKTPYGYKGFGDISVFLFFGLLGVGGTFFLYAKQFDWQMLLPAASCGLFSAGVLNINNIRDIESDREAGKISIPVRIGRQNAIIYHWILLITGMCTSALYVALNSTSFYNWLFLLVVPLLIINLRAVTLKHEAMELDPFLKQLALSTLIFVILFGIGVNL